MKIDVTAQNISADEERDVGEMDQGLSEIELDGRVLSLTGWYDRYALWYAKVALTPEQAGELRRALEEITDQAPVLSEGDRRANEAIRLKGGW